MQEKKTKVPSVDPIPDDEPQVETREPIISNFAEKAYAHERTDKEETAAVEPKDDST